MTDTIPLDLSGYPKPWSIEELNYETILAEMIAELVERAPQFADIIMLESEPARIVLEIAAYRELLIRQRVNDAFKAELLAFSTVSDLDHLAAFYDVVRMIEDGVAEDDERLRVRVILAIRGRSTGGTAPRYAAVAMASSLRVKSVHVYKTGTNPTVHIAVYAADNDGVADQGLLSIVDAAVKNPAVRMVNDTIEVRAAVFSVQNIVADLWLLPDTPDSATTALVTSLRAAWSAETGLGFDLNRAWLTARLMRPGVQRVEIVTPDEDIVAEPFQAISIGTVTLNIRGRTS